MEAIIETQEETRNELEETPKPSHLFALLTETIGPIETDPETARLIESLAGRPLTRDVAGNYFLEIEGNDDVVFAAHLDTVAQGKTRPQRYMLRKPDGSFFMETDGKSILGADDRSGCALLVYMILSGVPGTYYFFTGEEVGCVGSRKAAEEGLLAGKKAIVSFDRAGYDSVITHQLNRRTASTQFAQALAAELERCGVPGYAPDPTGVYTDSVEFADYVPECTNVSVGYNHQHSGHELQDLTFLDRLGAALLGVDWANLPFSRDPGPETAGYGRRYDGYGRRRVSMDETFEILMDLDDDPTAVWELDEDELNAVLKAFETAFAENPKGMLEEIFRSTKIAEVLLYAI